MIVTQHLAPFNTLSTNFFTDGDSNGIIHNKTLNVRVSEGKNIKPIVRRPYILYYILLLGVSQFVHDLVGDFVGNSFCSSETIVCVVS